MDRDEILDLLPSQNPELRRFGVKSLALFGLLARDESVAHSDVDILVDFEKQATFDA